MLHEEDCEDEFEEEDETGGLTERELQVAGMVGLCMTYVEIAEELGLAYETVKTYAKRVRKKLGFNSKVQIALWAKEKGLIDD
tara:strand:- start:1281 stop:1529 length:249 start_codon:yes stop_codon:yes gene_type:complete